ncbi:MAG: glutamine--fructose-6-phosphate transaminase (isomerizing) [Deltaproteobacteria bacterium]|nr:glutamine--fructose-6-phosphate transaminase (isomerizing) [Deltaproteobacteria bacterium]MBW2413217.1 glutamine--fructose-6-phosphate transaminase (isomerizing) [Deltaproteobacteria bacterium]
MCGIVGYVGSEERAQDVVLDGLRRLEYRGYDSAGIAVIEDGKLRVVRAVGKLVNLESALRDVPVHGATGMGHTRWATHGKPTEENAHPHRVGTIALIHNGIVENHRALRAELIAQGFEFRSDTDTEIIACLIHAERQRGVSLLDSVRGAVGQLEGSYAITVIDESEPGRIVAAKEGGSPCILGLGDGENFVASDIPAILPYCRVIMPLEDGEIALLDTQGAAIFDRHGARVEREALRIHWDPVQAEKGGYSRFMEKEIHEQPRAISDTIGTRVLEEDGDIDLDGIEFDEAWVRGLRGIQIVACGTAWHAGLLGRSMLEGFARIPTDVDLASEFRYRDPLLGPNHLLIAMSQSGETADTLAALREGQGLGARSLAVCNGHASTIARDADDVLYTHAGPEICVASTKCFTTQVTALYLIALKLGLLRGTLDHDAVRGHIESLRRLPRLVERCISGWDGIEAIARKYLHARDFLFLGRGVGFPVALEGALKLKELSYIHAEGYAAGEMKHGPIALIEDGVPVVAVANQRATRAKLISNAEEARSRGARVIAVAEEGDDEAESYADDVIRVPAIGDPLSAVVATIPLQIFAYHVATLKGTDVDQPRNLAKSVTVE